ncbi:NUDIX hydrolase [Leucobacter viscericola]|uniref:NUDIX hydrolase n=1 Tax=Leucobacter viscericola TaxID=2714935 RepID=UPI003CC7458B
MSERRTLPPAVAVSTVAFALTPPAGAALDSSMSRGSDSTSLWIPLVRRTRAPFHGMWALPGGPTRWDETLAGTALRTLHDAVLRAPGYLEQLYSFGGVERSAQAQRLVTIAYWALYGEGDLAADPVVAPASEKSGAQVGRWDDPSGDPAQLPGADRAEPDSNVAWFSADHLPELAFDHGDIVAYALSRLRSKTEYSTVAHRFLGREFTLAQLRQVHEAVRGQTVDPANFRRQALAQGYLVDTGERETGTHYRPARLYRFAAEVDPSAGTPDALFPQQATQTQAPQNQAPQNQASPNQSSSRSRP